jgi:hypothetical protein
MILNEIASVSASRLRERTVGHVNYSNLVTG